MWRKSIFLYCYCHTVVRAIIFQWVKFFFPHIVKVLFHYITIPSLSLGTYFLRESVYIFTRGECAYEINISRSEDYDEL